jgi:hypothetical protein
MSIFTKEDFLKPEVGQKLSVIIMSKLEKNVLTPFNKLTIKDKKKFNEMLNGYITSLGKSWEETLTKDFNEVCTLDLFDPENFFKPENIPTQVGESELILTEEQKQFEEDMKDPVKKALWEENLKVEILEAERKALAEGRVHIISNPEDEIEAEEAKSNHEFLQKKNTLE